MNSGRKSIHILHGIMLVQGPWSPKITKQFYKNASTTVYFYNGKESVISQYPTSSKLIVALWQIIQICEVHIFIT